MSGAVELADDTLRAIAAGVYPPTYAEERALAAEVLRLRDRADGAEAARDALRAAALEYTDAYVAACEAIARVAGRKDLEAAWGAAGVARARLRALAGEG